MRGTSLPDPVDHDDVGVLPNAVEHDLATVGRSVEAVGLVSRLEVRESTLLSRLEVDQPEVLVPVRSLQDDETSAVAEEAVSIRLMPNGQLRNGVWCPRRRHGAKAPERPGNRFRIDDEAAVRRPDQIPDDSR